MQRPATMVVAGALLVLSPALGGCALIGRVPDPTDTPSASASATPDAAGDVLYLQRMVVFDRQQLALADLALRRSQDESVRALATAMRQARSSDLATLSTALEDLGSAPPAPGSPEGAGWPGLLTARQLQAVSSAQGTAFDRLWPAALALVDQNALAVTRVQLAATSDATARDYATRQIETLTAEYSTASRLAGPLSTRATLPPG